MCDCRAVVYYLVEGFFFVGFAGVEDGEEAVCAGGEEESGEGGVQG